MRIVRTEIKKVSKILKDIVYHPTDTKEKSYIFFPIDTNENKQVDGFDFNVKDKASGVREELAPGLVLFEEDGKTVVDLGYASLNYSPYFNLRQYLEILGENPSKALSEVIENCECFLVEAPYLKARYIIK